MISAAGSIFGNIGNLIRAGRRVMILAALLPALLALPGMTETSRGQESSVSIAFLNPSSFAASAERGIILSPTKPNAGPGCDTSGCAGTQEGYRLSAWVSGAPEDATVFFSVKQQALEIEITNVQRVGTDTWESRWTPPAVLLDGPATVSAFLVRNNESLAATTQAVTIMRVQESTNISYPLSGGIFGSFEALATELPSSGASRRLPVGVIDAPFTDSPDISYVRSFYTTSAPGQNPIWEPCGTESTVGSPDNRAGNGVRCTLASPAQQEAITAISTVANDSPDDYDTRFNQSGDAVRVIDPYVQTLTGFEVISNTTQKVARSDDRTSFYCSNMVAALLVDQFGRGISGANIDVHATGPSDDLKFHTFSVLTSNQPPDRGHATEKAYDCTGQVHKDGTTTAPGNANPSIQGEHQRFGAADRKHIETLPRGSNDRGIFEFRLHSDVAGTTEFTMWVDEVDDGCLTNDDHFTIGELSDAGMIGWGMDPLATEETTPGDVTPCTPGSTEPTPLPSPSTSPSPDPSPEPAPEPEPEPTPTEPSRARRDLSIEATDLTPTLGTEVAIVGGLASPKSSCTDKEVVKLKARRGDASFKTIARTKTTKTGRYRFDVTIQKTKDYRTVAPRTSACRAARSKVIEIRPR